MSVSDPFGRAGRTVIVTGAGGDIKRGRTIIDVLSVASMSACLSDDVHYGSSKAAESAIMLNMARTCAARDPRQRVHAPIGRDRGAPAP